MFCLKLSKRSPTVNLWWFCCTDRQQETIIRFYNKNNQLYFFQTDEPKIKIYPVITGPPIVLRNTQGINHRMLISSEIFLINTNIKQMCLQHKYVLHAYRQIMYMWKICKPSIFSTHQCLHYTFYIYTMHHSSTVLAITAVISCCYHSLRH